MGRAVQITPLAGQAPSGLAGPGVGVGVNPGIRPTNQIRPPIP